LVSLKGVVGSGSGSCGSEGRLLVDVLRSIGVSRVGLSDRSVGVSVGLSDRSVGLSNGRVGLSIGVSSVSVGVGGVGSAVVSVADSGVVGVRGVSGVRGYVRSSRHYRLDYGVRLGEGYGSEGQDNNNLQQQQQQQLSYLVTTL